LRSGQPELPFAESGLLLKQRWRQSVPVCKAERADGVLGLVMMKTKGIKIRGTEGLADFQGDSAGKKKM
jgi:hypothetical protein